MVNVENGENGQALDRLKRLEMEIIQLRWRANLGLGLSLFFLLFVLSMVATPYSRRASFDQVNVRKLVTEQLQVKAENHKAYGAFWIGSHGKPALNFFDEEDRCRMQLELDEHGSPVLGTYRGPNDATFQLTNKPDGSPVLKFFDKSRTARLVIDAESDGSSSGVHLFDNSGHRRAALATRAATGTDEGFTNLYFLRSGEARALDVGITHDDRPAIFLIDSQRKRRAGMFLTKQEDAVVRATGPGEISSVGMAGPVRGEPYMYSFDGTRELRFSPQPK